MSERFRIVRLKQNPISKRRRKGKARNPRRRKSSRSKRSSSPRPRRRSKIIRRRGFIVEAMKEAGHKVRFLFWNGRGFVASRSAARIFRHEKDANHAARASMRRRPASFRFARVVPA